MSTIVSGVAVDDFSTTLSIKHSRAAQNHKTIPMMMMMMMTKMTMMMMTKMSMMAKMTKTMMIIL